MTELEEKQFSILNEIKESEKKIEKIKCYLRQNANFVEYSNAEIKRLESCLEVLRLELIITMLKDILDKTNYLEMQFKVEFYLSFMKKINEADSKINFLEYTITELEKKILSLQSQLNSSESNKYYESQHEHR